MVLNKIEIISKIDKVLVQFDAWNHLRPHYGNENDYEMFTLLCGTISAFAPSDSQFNLLANEAKRGSIDSYGDVSVSRVKNLGGVLKSLRLAYEYDLLQSVENIVHANLFSDFLEMAGYLIEEGYYVPAAVLIGGVLEEHLVKLSQKNNVNIIGKDGKRIKAESINQELARTNIYTKTVLKEVTALLDLRNLAAHPPYQNFTSEDIRLMLQRVNIFIQQNPL